MIRAQDFDDFVELHYSSVFWACRHHTPCVDTAWEAFQETYMAFLKRKDSLDLERDLEAWLRETARRCSLSVSRRKHRERSLDLVSEGDDAVLAGQANLNPSLRAEREELLEILREEISRLEHEDRMILRMVYQDSKSHRQIASLLDYPAGSVYSRVDSARTKLKQRMVRRGVAFAVVLWLLHLCEPEVFAGTLVDQETSDSTAAIRPAGMAMNMRRNFAIAASVVVLCVALEQFARVWFDALINSSSNTVLIDGDSEPVEFSSSCTDECTST